MFEKNSQLSYRTVMPRRVHQTKLVKSPLAFLEKAGQTTMLCSAGESHILLDFDAEMVGGLEITVTCATDAHIRVDYEEQPDYALRKEPLACNWYQLVVDEYDLSAGTHTLVSKGRRGFRFVNITATGRDNVRLDHVQAINGGWPVSPRGMFRCSDDQLNRVWDISAATVRACMQTFYEDGVKRDGLLWLGDYHLTFPSAWYAFGDAGLARRSLFMMRDSQYPSGAIPACAARGGGEQHHCESGIAYMPGIPGDGQNRWIIPNYMCDYIRSIESYVRLTGDRTVLPEMVDSARRAMEYLLSMVDFEKPGSWWIDTYASKRDEQGLNYTILMGGTIGSGNTPSKGALLMEMLMSLDSIRFMAKETGDDALDIWAQEQYKKLDDHIETHYREKTHGEYLDEYRQRFRYISQFVAPRAVLAGKDDPLGMERMIRSTLPFSGFSLAWRIEALFRSGYTQEALRDIRRAWGRMLDQDSRTCWEGLNTPEANENNYYDAVGSYCHGWSASPAWQLPMWVVGVKPTSVGFRSVEIAPQLDDLQWAEATVPVTDGEIFVRTEQHKGNMTITLDLPVSVSSCLLRWPSGREENVHTSGVYTMNG